MTEIARLREFAAAGLSMRAASRRLGRDVYFVRRWAPRYGISFIPYSRPPKPQRTRRRPPPDPALVRLAMARLTATMQRLIARP